MPGPFADLPFLFAQKAAAGGDAGGGFAQTLIIFAPAILLFYLMLIRPQQQQEKKRRQMIDTLKKNDRVLTHAGIYGTVVSINPEADKVVLRVDDDKNIRFEFSKASIARVIDTQAEKEKEKDKAAGVA